MGGYPLVSKLLTVVAMVVWLLGPGLLTATTGGQAYISTMYTAACCLLAGPGLSTTASCRHARGESSLPAESPRPHQPWACTRPPHHAKCCTTAVHSFMPSSQYTSEAAGAHQVASQPLRGAAAQAVCAAVHEVAVATSSYILLLGRKSIEEVLGATQLIMEGTAGEA